jgi:VAD1 Analog of StAR-related lipid transfer domain
MKSVILSNTAKESKSFWEAWVVWIKDRGLDF